MSGRAFDHGGRIAGIARIAQAPVMPPLGNHRDPLAVGSRGAPAPRVDDAPEAMHWDTTLALGGGDLLQSWRWGTFKQIHGWHPERIRTPGGAMAQLLFRRRGPFTLAYLPRGPVVPAGCPDADTDALLAAIDAACRAHGVISLIVEPHGALPASWLAAGGFAPGPEAFQTSRTVRVTLADDEALLADMRRQTRYDIRTAQRRGVQVQEGDMATFFPLLRETSMRQGFGIHTRQYYVDFMHHFGDDAVLLLARAEGTVTAGLIAARCGAEGRSMYAGSSTAHRERGDAALLRLAAMQWTRDGGGTRYDLGGIAPAATEDGPTSSLDGVSRFKLGFGGEVVTFPEPLERCYRPAMAGVLRRLHPRFRRPGNG